MNKQTYTVTIDLDKYEYPKEKEQQLVDDIQWDLEEGIDRCVKSCIHNLNKTKGMLETGWKYFKEDGSMMEVLEVNESRAIVREFPSNSESKSYSISAYTSVEKLNTSD